MYRILIIDDDKLMNDALSRAIKRMGHNVTCKLCLKEGLNEANSNPYDVIYLDVRMPDGDGLEALPKFREAPSSPEIIIITGFANSRGAELAIKSGVWDYLKKPSSIEEMTLPLIRALQYRNEKLATGHAVALELDGIVGCSPQIKDCLDHVANAANCDANVLLIGETGTGKECFARAIHKNSPRANRNFVVVDCTVLPETLVEALLFGHKKGAYTDANKAKEGLVKHADGGTLFLDEVGELPLNIQKKFLRVLQERHFRPIGGRQEIQSNFRLIAATNRDLDRMVEKKLFREDLLFRLRSLFIALPPLRERKDDIRELLAYYSDKICENYKISTKGFSPEFIEALNAYDWPGNIRELINTLESIIVSARDVPIIFPYHLPDHIRIRVAQTSIGEEISSDGVTQKIACLSSPLPMLREYREAAIESLEKEYLEKLMATTQGDINESCRISGLSRSYLYNLMKKYKVSRSVK